MSGRASCGRRGLVVAGTLALAGGAAVVLAPPGAAGPVAGAACIALLVPVVGGVVRGVGWLQPPPRP